MTQTFEHAVLEMALTELFSKKYFDICQLEKVGELIGVNPKQHPNYKLLNTLHCVDFNSMSQVIRNELQERVVQCLRPQFAFTGAVLAKALMIEGQNHTPIEDNYIESARRLR